LAVVLEHAAANRDIFTSERCAAGVGILKNTIFYGQIIAGEFDCAVLGAVGGVSKTNAFKNYMVALDGQDCVAGGSFDYNLLTADVLVIIVPDIEAFVIQINVEGAPGELVAFKDLTQCVAANENLLAPADEAVEIIVRMSMVGIICNELVWPGRAVDMSIALNFSPLSDMIGSGHNHVCSNRRLQRDGPIRKAALFDIDFFTIHAVVDYYRISGFCEQGGLAYCPELFCLLNPGKLLS